MGKVRQGCSLGCLWHTGMKTHVAKVRLDLSAYLSCPFQIKTSLLYSEDKKKLLKNFM